MLTEEQKLFVVELRKTHSYRAISVAFDKKWAGIVSSDNQLDGMALCDEAGVIEVYD